MDHGTGSPRLLHRDHPERQDRLRRHASSDSVTPISTATNKAGKAIKVGIAPYYIAITPNGKTAYVANSNSGTVTPISTATNKAGKAIKVATPGLSPVAIAITPNGKTAYAVNTSSGTAAR